MADDRITAALRGAPPQLPAIQPPMTQPGGDDTAKGDGSAQSGYAAPEFGPFECENCVHFQPPGMCQHPEVVSDPEVEGMVDPEGCCNFFQSAHNESQAQEHSEGNEQEESEGSEV